jgi:hypothetical protein
MPAGCAARTKARRGGIAQHFCRRAKSEYANYERFTYAPNTTDVHTRISEVFASGCGVCQDFAHIFIAAVPRGWVFRHAMSAAIW